MDGRRAFPEDDQEPRWDSGGYAEPAWRTRDDSFRVPEPRPAEGSSFDGFSTGERRWDPAQPQTQDQTQTQPQPAYGTDDPPWNSGPPTPLPPVPPPTSPLSVDPGPPPAEDQLYRQPDADVDAAPLEAPTGAMPFQPQRFHAEAIDRAALRRTTPAAPTAAIGDGVYRTKRPAVALLYAALTLVFEIGAVRVFLDGMFGGPFQPATAVAGMFLIAGLPLFALGLYGTTSGQIRAEAAAGWLRPPAVYLVAGLGLLVAAGLAAA